ncbi:MAG: ribonuclease III [Lachnospiraceae bacterium]|nr:ribonuclease III [Lachnospiraceae bacterium]
MITNDLVEKTSAIVENEGTLKDVRQVPALTLAYLGDAIYELVLRTMLVEQGLSHVDSLNKKASGYAKAPTQAKIFRIIEESLSEEELGFYKRGRNAKSGSVAKSGTVMDYRMATGFESMLGYLYLSGKQERILELVMQGINGLEK